MNPSFMKKNNTSSNYVPFLDGLRGFAIAIVLIAHAGLDKLVPGGFGVTVFFFISGYLITKLLIREVEDTGKINLQNFYLRRFFRLYPALIAFILLGCISILIIGCTVSAKDILSALFYFTNYYIGWIRQPVEDCSRILDITWSLSIEEHFYLFFPLLSSYFIAGNHQNKIRIFTGLLFLLCFLALAARLNLVYTHPLDPQNAEGRIYFSTHTRMDAILYGCIAALLLFKVKSRLYLFCLKNRIALSIALVILLTTFLIRGPFFRNTLRFTLQGLSLLIIIPFLERWNNPIKKMVFENRLIILIGKISYSLYLFHWIVLKIANHYLPEFSFYWQLVYWPISILLGLISYFFLERTFIAMRKKFGSHASI
ncbi:MAG: acyltransferase [Bacteroidota bacterium]